MVSARHKGKLEKKIVPIIQVARPFPSWPSVARGNYLQFPCTGRVLLNKTGLLSVPFNTNMNQAGLCDIAPLKRLP